MGKRELLLIGVFVVFGFVVFQATKPAGDPNRPGWSFGGIVEQIRREVRGDQARAQVTNTQTIAAPASLKEIRIERFPSEVVVLGEDRDDISLELRVDSRAYDDEEAKKTAAATKVAVDQAGEMLRLTMSYPREGRQTAMLALKVPKRLALRIDEKGGKLVVTGIAALTIGGAGRGETVITEIQGPVQATQRGTAITITNVGSLRLTAFNTGEVRIIGVRGNATINLQGGDDVRVGGVEGQLEVEARNADIKFENLAPTRGPIRLNLFGGEAVLAGLQTETRIDARRADVRVEQSAAAPLAIYADGETMEVTLPPSGYVIDAMTVDGRMTVDKGLEAVGLKVADAGEANAGDKPREARVTGTVRNGGPTITLRSTRGEIELRSRN